MGGLSPRPYSQRIFVLALILVLTCQVTTNPPLLFGHSLSIAQSLETSQALNGTNLVANPDFEAEEGKQQPDWTAYQKLDGSVLETVTDSRIAHSGTRCVKIQQTTKSQRNFAAWIQNVQVAPGIVYRFSFWIRTGNIRPSISSPNGYPYAGANGYVELLKSRGEQSITIQRTDYGSSMVQMTHEWKKVEISFKTPNDIHVARLNLALRNAIGIAYFDSVSLASSVFEKVPSPSWLTRLVLYELAPWQFLHLGGGYGGAFRGVISKLPEIEDLGVNGLYLLPIWEDRGTYGITDHFSIFRGYGTPDQFKALVEEVHRRNMKVILDLAGTIGISPRSDLVLQHPEWFVLNENDSIHYSWGPWLLGLDTNRPDVQQYFVDVAKHYVERFDVDGYRCDSARVPPYEMFEKIRVAI